MAYDAARPFGIVIRLCATVVMAGAILCAPNGIPPAAAQGCPDIEVLFARGTGDPPGIGDVGQAFVDSLRSKVGGRSVGVMTAAPRPIAASKRPRRSGLPPRKRSSAPRTPDQPNRIGVRHR